MERAIGEPSRPDAVVGVGSGVRKLTMLSTGEALPTVAPIAEV